MSLKTTKRKEQKAYDGPVENFDNDLAATVAVEDPPHEEAAPKTPAPVAVGRSLEELLIDKLKLLEYEQEFCRKKKPYRKTLGRAYFAAAIPGNEQFHTFSSLAAWLLTSAGSETSAPKPEEDPISVCGNLITQAMKLGFSKPGYTSAKLTMGQGKEVCGFLDGLVDYVLERRRFSYRTPTYIAEAVIEDPEADEAEDAGMEGADEMAGAMADDYEEEAYMEAGHSDATPGEAPEQQLERQVLVSKVDPTLWKMELERVGPKLRITIAADSKDWRNHLDEAHNLHKTITSAWPDSKVALERLLVDLATALEKLQSREKYLNDQFENLMQQYRAARVQLGDAQEMYNKRTENVSDRNSELSRITEQIEEIKQVLDERGSTIGDATPVARIKAAIKKLGDELHEMAVKIGVVSNAHLQLSLKNKRLMQSQAAQLSDDDDD